MTVTEKKQIAFEDAATFDPVEKTAISVRDGVLEYLGAELGIEPYDKIFRIYRSPATIANAASKMAGIPLTDEHVSLDESAPQTGSAVTESVVIDLLDACTNTRLGVRNRLAVNDSALEVLKSKRELSLGYHADLVPHDEYDFEQVNIIPHHLAAVPAGRCGSLCSFLDRKPTQKQEGAMPELHKAFHDAEGAVNLEQIVEIAMSLPEAIKKVPTDKLSELMPALLEIMTYAKDQGAMPEVEEEEMTDEEAEPTADETGDGERPKFSDADFRDAVAKAANAEVQRFAGIISKARNFLDADYDYVGKTANDVMRDAIATQSSHKFDDEKLPVAFELLRKSNTDYSQFGDAKPDSGLAARIKAELGE